MPSRSTKRAAVSASLSEALKAAIAASSMNFNQLAVAAGIPPIAVGRFVRGERDLRLATASKLAQALGLHLVKEES